MDRRHGPRRIHGAARRVGSCHRSGLWSAGDTRPRNVLRRRTGTQRLRRKTVSGKVLALFDGRRSELLAYGLRLENGSYLHDGYTAVFHSPEELAQALADYSCTALEKDRAAIAKFDPEAEKRILFTPSIRAEELIFNDPENFSASPTDLIYLRAAVFVAPRIPRKI